jgi:hypothetical protein
MTVTYTNQILANIVEPLKSLLITEFKPMPVVFEEGFNSSLMTRGGYIRMWPGDSTIVSQSSDGETREYTLTIARYFEAEKFRVKTAFDKIYSDEAEHLRTLLATYRYYNDGTYRWHGMDIVINPLQTVMEAEDIENETAMVIKFDLKILRSNYL